MRRLHPRRFITRRFRRGVQATFAAGVILSSGGPSGAATGTPTVRRLPSPVPLAQAFFGAALAGVGDVSGDGVPDVAVGAPGADRVYVFSGLDASIIRIIADPNPELDHLFGNAVAGIGDVDLDGVGDLAVGAPLPISSPSLPVPSPEVCLVEPCPPPVPRPLDPSQVYFVSGATGEIIRRLLPDVSAISFGWEVAPLGDINGDGTPDVVASDPAFIAGLSERFARVAAFSGADGSAIWTTQNNLLNILFFGLSLATTADLDGDGRRDVLTSAFDDRAATPVMEGIVLSGFDGHIVRVHLTPIPESPNFPAHLGMADVGDQDGDGTTDYIIGEPRTRRIIVSSGRDGHLISGLDGPAGGDAADGFGYSIAGVDDKDGDGLNDFWVAAPGMGQVYLLNKFGTVLAQVSDPTPPPLSVHGFLSFGHRLAAVENLGGDRGLDLVVGEPDEPVAFSGGDLPPGPGPGPGSGGPSPGSGSLPNVGAAYVVTLASGNRFPIAEAGPDRIVAAGERCTGETTLDGGGSEDFDGNQLRFKWSGPFGDTIGQTLLLSGLSLGDYTFTLTIDDEHGGTALDNVKITVADLTAPVLKVGAPTGPFGLPVVTAADNCDGPVAVFDDAPSVLPLGTTLVTFTAKDTAGNAASFGAHVTITDTSAPSIERVTATLRLLWPPTHAMVRVGVAVVASDDHDPSPVCRITGVSSNEPVDGPGDGHTAPDWLIAGDLAVNLRAERSGKGSGRRYTIAIRCTDASQNAADGTVHVDVPFSQRAPK